MMNEAAPDATINSAAEDLLASLYGDRQAALVMALFEDEGYHNKPEYRDLFSKDGECLVKGIVFMGTPFRGSGQAALFAPFIKAATISRPTGHAHHAMDNGRNGANPVRSSTHPNNRGTNDDDDPLNRLILFDTVIIIDDTGSMIKAARDKEPEGEDRWSATAGALKHIAQIAASKDPDGIDIRFLKAQSLNEDNITNGATVLDIISLIDMYDGTHGGGTVFKEHLENEISPRLELYRDYLQQDTTYKADLRRLAKDRQARARLVRPKPPNKLNLIVITDGQADDKQEVEDYIVATATELDRLGAPAAQIGVQFAQIGEDEMARRYLKRLDDDLKKRKPTIRDIVDTTRCDSDIAQGASFNLVLEQVLLGAVTKDIDDRNTNDDSNP
ncbi:hypothetical protein P7C71_g3009, partial [Lecanoromycetidae sp. Uapishka_2]